MAASQDIAKREIALEMQGRATTRTRRRTKKTAPEITLFDLRDIQSGPLAELEAMTDVLTVAAMEGVSLRDHSLPTLMMMFYERLAAVRDVINDPSIGSAES